MKALDLAKYIINKCTEDDMPISNLQLQKILYFIQLEFYKQLNEPAFEDEIEAWQFGPVVPNVYYIYSGSGAIPIRRQYDIKTNEMLNDETKRIIDKIVSDKRIKSPWDLVGETHVAGGPWDKIYNKDKSIKQIIPKSVIEEYV